MSELIILKQKLKCISDIIQELHKLDIHERVKYEYVKIHLDVWAKIQREIIILKG